MSLSNEQPVLAEGPVAPLMSIPALTSDAPNATLSVTLGEDLAPRFAAVSPSVPAPGAQESAPLVTTEPAAPPETAKVETTLEVPADTGKPELSSTADTVLSGDAQQAPTTVDRQDITPQIPVMDTNVATAPAAIPEPETVAEQDVVVAPAQAEPAPVPEANVEQPAVVAQNQATVADVPAAVREDPVPAPPPPAQTPPSDAPESAPEASAPARADAVATTQTGPAVRINRPGIDPVEPSEAETEAAEPEGVSPDAPALLRFAAPFENPAGLPVISVVLVDDGTLPDAAQVIAGLPFQPTVVVDALAVNAGDTAARYRAAGVEVAMQLALPSGAQPVDVEVAFEAAFGIVAEAAVLFSDGTGILQDNRRVTTQVMQILADEGRGFVSVQRGLGNALRTAEQDGVPSAEILRDLDGAGEDAGAMSRALDQAAFRARQSGASVVMGRMTPQTLAVLTDWSADLDTDTLLIAPVSAILLGQTAE